jgi:hypothetical protein
MYTCQKVIFEKLKECAANNAEDLESGNLRESSEGPRNSNYSTFQ